MQALLGVIVAALAKVLIAWIESNHASAEEKQAIADRVSTALTNKALETANAQLKTAGEIDSKPLVDLAASLRDQSKRLEDRAKSADSNPSV